MGRGKKKKKGQKREQRRKDGLSQIAVVHLGKAGPHCADEGSQTSAHHGKLKSVMVRGNGENLQTSRRTYIDGNRTKRCADGRS